VTPYPVLLFVSNMQSMKVDTQPRPSPSLLSWFLKVVKGPRSYFFGIVRSYSLLTTFLC